MRKSKPLYRVIIDDLKQQILNRNFEYDVPFTTEKKLMEKYNVSRITAMNALAELDKAGIIHRKRHSGSYVTFDGMLIVEEEFGARSPVVIEQKEKDVTLIALILPFDPKHGGMMECLCGINEILNENNCYLSIYNSYRNPEKESEILRSLISKGADGIICYPYRDNFNADIYNHCTLSGLPLVLIDQYIEGVPITHVISDNFGGTKQLTEMIIDKGHKKIAFISEGAFGEVTSVKNRYLGYINALYERGIPLVLDLVKIRMKDKYKYHCKTNNLHSDEYHYENYFTEQLKELHRMGVTAIVCENDWVAIKVMQIFKSLKISVPDSISVAGYDNVSRLTENGIKLATVEQDFYEMGKRAAEIICNQIEHKGNMRIRNVVPVKVIEGTTVKQLN